MSSKPAVVAVAGIHSLKGLPVHFFCLINEFSKMVKYKEDWNPASWMAFSINQNMLTNLIMHFELQMCYHGSVNGSDWSKMLWHGCLLCWRQQQLLSCCLQQLMTEAKNAPFTLSKDRFYASVVRLKMVGHCCWAAEGWCLRMVVVSAGLGGEGHRVGVTLNRWWLD